MHPVSCLEQGSTPGLPAVSRTRVHACVSPEPPLLTATAGSSAPRQPGHWLPQRWPWGSHLHRGVARPGTEASGGAVGGSPAWQSVPKPLRHQGPSHRRQPGCLGQPCRSKGPGLLRPPSPAFSRGEIQCQQGARDTPGVTGLVVSGQDETSVSWGSGGPGIRARALRPAWVPSPSAVGAGTSSGLRGPLLPGTHPPAARPQAGGREEGRVV